MINFWASCPHLLDAKMIGLWLAPYLVWMVLVIVPRTSFMLGNHSTNCHTSSAPPKSFHSWPAATLGVWDPSALWSLSQDELLNIKDPILVDILQCTEAEEQKPTNKVGTFRDLFRTTDCDVLSLCFHFGSWYYLHAEFHGLTCIPISCARV